MSSLKGAVHFLFLVAVVFVYLIVSTPLGECSNIEKAIQSAGIFVALLAAVIALSATDPKIRSVKVNIVQSVDKAEANIGKYHKNKLCEELKKIYQNFPDPIKSHKVQFKMTNVSGFTLKKPTLTFRLPLEKQHPDELGQFRTFNSNLFSSQRELSLLEFADTCILSNSNLPYWNDQDDITIWIRMLLDDEKLEPFIVEVSINCENAEGITNELKINPKS